MNYQSPGTKLDSQYIAKVSDPRPTKISIGLQQSLQEIYDGLGNANYRLRKIFDRLNNYGGSPENPHQERAMMSISVLPEAMGKELIDMHGELSSIETQLFG